MDNKVVLKLELGIQLEIHLIMNNKLKLKLLEGIFNIK